MLRDHEQVVTSAITVFGTTTFSTHTPVDPGGRRLHVEPRHGAGLQHRLHERRQPENGTLVRNEIIVGGGLPPSPVAGMVTLDDGTTVPFLIGGEPDSPLEGVGARFRPASRTQPKA